MIDDLEKIEVTGPALAGVFALSVSRISQLEQQGVIHRAPSGKFLLADSIRSYITWIKDEQRHSSKSAAAQRVQAARAAEIEQRTQERGRQLIPMDETKAMIIEIIGGLRADLDGIAAGVTRDLTLRKKIEKTLNNILTRAANRLDKQSADIGAADRAEQLAR